MQRQAAVAMERAHEDMARKHRGFEEQITSYHQFIDSSMTSLQKGKVQHPCFCHEGLIRIPPVARRRRRSCPSSTSINGRKPSLGRNRSSALSSIPRRICIQGVRQRQVFSAHCSWPLGILLGISQVSPTVFHDVHIVIASNEVGVFSLEMTSSTIPLPTNAVMGREQVRMEDLLQAQFENELNLLLFDGMATFSINMLIHQINKSRSFWILAEQKLMSRLEFYSS